MHRFQIAALVVLALTGLTPAGAEKSYPFAFRDVGDETGLFPDAGGIRGHGAAWGDIDGDGWPELFVNAFHDNGSKAAMLFRNEKGKFRLDGQEHVRTSGMGSGALFVDLTNNGRLDLYSSTCAIDKNEVRRIPSYLFRNDGGGKFTDVTKDSGASFPLFAGRGLSALDADGDGLLDLALCERYYGPVKYGPTLLHNKGKHQFDNISKEAGLPVGLSSLGIAAADLNADGWPDLVISESAGNHRLLLNDKKGKFVEAPGSREVLQWKNLAKDDTPTGISIADLNRDGLPDIVIAHHNDAPWRSPAPIRLYLHRGVKDGIPKFEEITQAAGLTPLTMKPPHVEIQDFDNDGWPDIYVSIVRFKDGKPCPTIFKNLGVTPPAPPSQGGERGGGIPRFRDDASAVNDFPTKDDLAVKASGKFFDKILKEKKIMYMAAAPSGDFDRDGRIDMFLANWWIEDRSLLLKNETPGGHWLDVRVEGSKGVNRMGVGSKVDVYAAGKLGDASSLIGSREITIGYGYCSGQEAICHFGLGKVDAVDVEVTLPHGKGKLVQKGVKGNQRITVK